VEDVFCDVIGLTGLTSVLACGGKQAAISHSVYAWLCNEHPELSRRFVHGELVGATLACQMLVSGVDRETIDAYLDFCRRHGAPVCLRELGIDCGEEHIAGLYAHLRKSMPIETGQEFDRLWNARNAMISADL